MWSGDQKIHAMKNWRDECCGVWWRSNKHGVSGRQSRVVTVGTGLFKSKEQLQLLTRISFGMFVQIGQGRMMHSDCLTTGTRNSRNKPPCDRVLPPVFAHPRAHIELGAVASSRVHVWVENSDVLSEFAKCAQWLEQVLKDLHRERRYYMRKSQFKTAADTE